MNSVTTLHGIICQQHLRHTERYKCLLGFCGTPFTNHGKLCHRERILNTFAKHYRTGEQIPAQLIQKIVDASNFNIAYACLRQLSFGLLDMAWYTRKTPFDGDVRTYEKEAWKKAQVLPSPAETCMSVQFSHIMAGGYSAGYYSYKWAEVLDADAFSLFKEKRNLQPGSGRFFPPEHFVQRWNGTSYDAL